MKKLFLFVFLFFGTAAFAQTPSGTGTSEQSGTTPTLESRLGEVETKMTTWQKIVAGLPKLSGYVQAGYQYTDNSSAFFLKRVRLSLAGDIVAEKLDYKIQFEFCKPQLVDAYVQYKPLRQLNIRLGQYKVPFSIDNTEYVPTQLELIEYPLALRKMMGFGEDLCGISATGRDLGAMLFGGFLKRDGYSIINYDLGLFNGEGINTSDKNKSKDLAARLTIKPVKGLMISGSYYWGEYGASYLLRERYAAGICYDRGAVVVRSEWIGGRTGSADGSFDSDGWYVMAGWRAPHNLMPAARFETFTQNDMARSATRQTNYTVGLLWAPVKYFRCQLNYTYEDYGSAYDLSGRNVVAVMFTGVF